MSSSAAAMIVTEIEPSTGLSPRSPRALAYRELLYFLVWRDVKVRYKQTALGAAWAILQPLLTMVVFSSSSASSRTCRPTACRTRCSPSPRWCRGPSSRRR